MARQNRRDDEQPRRLCATTEVHERLLRTSPAYVDARMVSEANAIAFSMRGFQQRQGVTVIPVVVHVVSNTQAQNISDVQIQSQIDVLNRDFRKTNPDVSSVPAPFQPLVGDARLEFELARTDPNGATTNGITRRQTTTANFGSDDKVKAASTGGTDAWPSDEYLNIWVCQLGGGLLGYAQFPGGPAATDGVVILHSAFGTSGTAAAPFNLGRTTTHEVGHWLNLRHIWGDDGTGCNGSDLVADTPNQGGPNYGSPSFPTVTCNNGPNGDLYVNYMDYVDDAAMVMFTTDQVTRMQACLDGDRPSLGSPKPTVPGTLKVIEDNPPVTLKFRDDPIGTLKFRDDPGTLKFIDDPIATLKFRDDGGPSKPPILDGQGKPPITDGPGLPGGPQGPMGPNARGGASPFVLSTPHHSMAWTQSFPDAAQATRSSYEETLRQYEEVLGQYAEASLSGQLTPDEVGQANALYDEYVAIANEYAQMGRG